MFAGDETSGTRAIDKGWVKLDHCIRALNILCAHPDQYQHYYILMWKQLLFLLILHVSQLTLLRARAAQGDLYHPRSYL